MPHDTTAYITILRALVAEATVIADWAYAELHLTFRPPAGGHPEDAEVTAALYRLGDLEQRERAWRAGEE